MLEGTKEPPDVKKKAPSSKQKEEETHEHSPAPAPHAKRAKTVKYQRHASPLPPPSSHASEVVAQAAAPPPIEAAKKGKYKRKRQDSDEDSDPGEFETFKMCKELNKIKDIENAYPYLGRQYQTAIRNGMRSVVQGGLRTYLNEDEKKAIMSKKDDYNKVLAKGGRKVYNPYVGKRKFMGDHFRKIIKEVRVQSDSDSSSDEGAESTLNWDGFM